MNISFVCIFELMIDYLAQEILLFKIIFSINLLYICLYFSYYKYWCLQNIMYLFLHTDDYLCSGIY